MSIGVPFLGRERGTHCSRVFHIVVSNRISLSLMDPAVGKVR